MPAGTTQVITNADGEIVEPTAMTDCTTGEFAQFVYVNDKTVPETLHSPDNLEIISSAGLCGPEEVYDLELADGGPNEHIVFNGYVYATAIAPTVIAEVIYVDACASSPVLGECPPEDLVGPICAALLEGWEDTAVNAEDCSEDSSSVELYLCAEELGFVYGSVSPSVDPCPSLSEKDILE